MKIKKTFYTTLCAVAAFTSVQAFAVDKAAIAEQLAAQLHASENLNLQIKQIERSQTPVLVNTFLAPQQALSTQSIGNTTEMWLYLPSDRALGDDMSDLVVAYPPSGNEQSWTAVKGYNLNGKEISLDVQEEPTVPVLVIDDNGYYAMKDSVQKLNSLLQKNGLQTKPALESLLSTQASAAEGFDSTKLTKVNVKDTHESWVKGPAETYALVTGVLSGNEPQIIAVEMPYLDYATTDYYPNQIVINWSKYNYRAVDMLMYEHDSQTNYKDMVEVLVTAIGAAGSLAGWAPSAAVAEITNRVITAMPDSWYTDDDDFIDACYTLEQDKSYTDFHCSSDNATISMEPFFVEAN